MILFPEEVTLQGEEYADEVLAMKFLADLTSYIEQTQEIYKPSGSISPSGLSCNRRVWFDRNIETISEGKPHTVIGITETGSFRHDKIQETLVEMTKAGSEWQYLDVEEYLNTVGNPQNLIILEKKGHETKLRNDKLDMNFLCDGILKYKGMYYILEIKTESTFKFRYRNDIAFEHKNQARAYAYNLGIDKVIFLYENRDFNDKKTFILSPTKEELDVWLEMIMGILNSKEPPELMPEFLEELAYAVETKKVPQKAMRELNWQERFKQCGYCPFQAQCIAHEVQKDEEESE